MSSTQTERICFLSKCGTEERYRLQGTTFIGIMFVLIVSMFIVLSGCTPKSRLIVENNMLFPLKIVEKYVDAEDHITTVEVGVAPAKRTTDFGRVLDRGDEKGNHLLELRTLQGKTVEQIVAHEGEVRGIIRVHINP